MKTIHSIVHRLSLVSALMLILASSWACTKSYSDMPDEDYKQLFPWQGISKSQRDKWNITPRPCTPNAELTSYIYNPMKRLADSRSYTVTLRCSYREYDDAGKLSTKPTARYRVMFINEQGLYDVAGDASDIGVTYPLTNGQEFVKTFTAYSAYPLFISVSGLGPQGSSVKASIEAVSTDGLIRIDPLSTEQNQNEEGPNYLKQPYCEYLLLP